MSISDLKKELYKKIDSSSDEGLLEIVYAILSNNVSGYELTNQQKKELNKRLALLAKREVKGTPIDESLINIRHTLH